MTVAPFVYDAIAGRVVFGVGARRDLGRELDALGTARAMVVASPDEDHLVDEIRGALGDRAVGRFRDVVQHVPVAKAGAARDLAVELRADTVVTIGGGSATGFGKAVALEMDVRQVALPTTYAGSEMTTIWGLTDGPQKRTGRDPRVKPEVVLYDPELTLTLPPRIAGPSGMNALAHCVEAIYGPGANPVVTLMALEGIQALRISLPTVCSRPDDLPARTDALYGAYLAGVSLASGGTALHHKACHVLGGMFDLNHGDLNAVVLPHALAYNAPALRDHMGRLAGALGRDDPAAALYDLARALDAPASLEALGMPADGIDAAAQLIVEEAAMNVRRPDVESIRHLLDDAYHGRRPAAVTV